MYKVLRCVFALTVFFLSIAGLHAGDTEQKVPLDKLPPEVKAAAIGAVKGLKLTSAESETKNSKLIYEVKGTADGKTFEVEVSSDGKVLKVENDDDDDDDDDDDND